MPYKEGKNETVKKEIRKESYESLPPVEVTEDRQKDTYKRMSNWLDAAKETPLKENEFKLAERRYEEYWMGDSYSKMLHSSAVSFDLKDEQGFTAGSEEQRFRSATDAELKKMSLLNSGRTEKTRRNHLSKASAEYEKASILYRELQGKKTGTPADGVNPAKSASQEAFENIEKAEAAIKAMCDAEAETIRAFGQRDDVEKGKLKALKERQITMLDNLYKQEGANPVLNPEHKERLMQKVFQLRLYKDATSSRLSFYDDSFMREKYSRYTELDDREIFDASEQSEYNTDEKKRHILWGRYKRDKYDGEGRTYGYIRTWNACRMNRYLRIRGKSDKETRDERMKIRESVKKSARKDMGITDETQLAEFADEWEDKTEEAITHMDKAVQSYTLTHDSRFYRMVDKTFLQWGLGLPEGTDIVDPAALVEKINQKSGRILKDPGYMSTGYCVDFAFAKQPIMMTLLTDKGKKCMVTKNFMEAEVIFPRDTRYQIVCAVNHSHDAQTLKMSKKRAKEDVKSADEMISTSTSFRGIEIIMKML